MARIASLRTKTIAALQAGDYLFNDVILQAFMNDGRREFQVVNTNITIHSGAITHLKVRKNTFLM